jgi:succinate dehydrogenase / fumarate reductase cytochrome b subunit
VLKGNLVLLWGVRAILLVSLLLHVHSAWGLTLLSRAARPARYAEVTHRASTLASRMMRIGGVVLLVFIVFHLLHFTTGTFHPSFADGDVFGNVVRGFQVTPVALFYVVAMVALMLHLRHGIWSFFQTLGLNHPHVNGIRRGLAWLLALGIGVGFISIPLAVLFRLVR